MTTDLEESIYGEPLLPELEYWHILLIVNALLGIILLEYAWYKLRRFRKPILELNA